jgi:hypothetical protein
MTNSSRRTGDLFEKVVIDSLNTVEGSKEKTKAFEMTAGSGSKFMDGDIRHRELVVECKVKNNCAGFSAPTAHLTKLKQEADKQCKDWLYVVKNGKGQELVLLELEAFLRLTDHWRQTHSE